AATVEDAKTLALDQLGVAPEDAEIEVLEEPKPGLFGRLRGEAKVRARVKPTSARESSRRERGGERGERRGGRSRSRGRNGDGSERGGDRRRERSDSRGPARERSNDRDRTEREDGDDDSRRRADAPKVPVTTVRDAATTFLDGLFAAAGLPATVESTIDGDDIEIAVNGDNLTMFVGARGATLTNLQDVTRVVSQRKLGDHDTRLRVDVGGYRQRRKDALGRFALKVANDVIESGTPRILEPMNSADRKIVHDTLANMDGIVTHSEGDDPFRRVVVSRAPGA
ncbi:MAG: RNA-binding cell elongation regulator Jag/EloR, partial [Ilumatobacteraceae bacterium]